MDQTRVYSAQFNQYALQSPDPADWQHERTGVLLAVLLDEHLLILAQRRHCAALLLLPQVLNCASHGSRIVGVRWAT